MEASKGLRREAAGWTRYCREFAVAKRRLCEQVVAILEAHPDRRKPPLPSIQISKDHTSETLVKLESMDFPGAHLDIPDVPTESLASSCCSPPPKSPRVADSSPPVQSRTPSKIGAFLKSEYTKICRKLQYKYEKVCPQQADLINSMLWDIKELQFNLDLLEMQCDKLQSNLEKLDFPAPILKRRTSALVQSFCDINLQYEKAIDCKTEFHKKMKKYVHNKLAGGDYAGDPEHQRSESPVAGCSAEQKRPSAKSPKKHVSSTTPQRSDRLAQAPASVLEDPQQESSRSSGAELMGEQNRPSAKTLQESASTTPQRRSNRLVQEPASSKRTPKHSAKDSREKKKLKMPEAEPLPVESSYPGRMVQVITHENRDDVNYELSSDSTEETSRDTISTSVYDSVIDMALADDGGKKKARSDSACKSKASPKKDRAETADVATTRSPSKSKHDPKETGAKPKKFFKKKTPKKSKQGYTSLPQTDSDSD